MSVDIARTRRKKTLRNTLVAAAIVLVAVGPAALTRSEPAAPTVARATLWIDTVDRHRAAWPAHAADTR